MRPDLKCLDETREIVRQFYESFFNGDTEGMLGLMADAVKVRFLAQVDLIGKQFARKFFSFSGGLLSELDFRIQQQIFDGEWAATLWTETGIVTASGKSWTNHGVDVIRVENNKVTVVHENNDVRLVHAHLPKFEINH
tara:strand:+ start:12711 stop:13124 length:414 start_codon:yes stop_codon:yes gene_type:complete